MCTHGPRPVAGADGGRGTQHLHPADRAPTSDGSVPFSWRVCPACGRWSLWPTLAARHPAPAVPPGAPPVGGWCHPTVPGQERNIVIAAPNPPLPLPCPAPSFLQGTPAHTPMMMSPAPSPMVVHSPYSQPPPSVVPPMQQPNTPAQQPSSVMARHPPNMVAQTPNMVTQTPPNIVAQPPNMAAPPNVVISHNAMSHLSSPHHMMQERPFYYAPSPNPMAVSYQMGVQSPMATIASVGATPMTVNGGFYSQTMKG